jgi:hypothetical protein
MPVSALLIAMLMAVLLDAAQPLEAKPSPVQRERQGALPVNNGSTCCRPSATNAPPTADRPSGTV